MTQRRVAVVGGGMAGLGAAWRLAEAGAAVTLLERETDLGGRCRTFEWRGDWRIRGAAAFIGAEDNLVEQARAIGLYRPETVEDATQRHSWRILHDGGRVFEIADFRARDILASGKLPLREKVALGRVLPSLLRQKARGDDRDPTTAVDLDTVAACDFFGASSPTFVDYILEPVMQMFCGYGAKDYSLAWLIWLMAGRFAWSSSWWTFAEGGVGRLPRALGEALADRAIVRTSAVASAVLPDADGVTVAWDEHGAAHRERFDAAVMALPGSCVAPVMPTLPAAQRAFFGQVEYVGHHIIYAILDCDGVEEARLLLPTAEGYRSLSNFELIAHPDGMFLYGEIKGARCAELASAGDEEIMADALADLTRALPELRLRGVIDRYVQRNDIALCRRHVGYTRALAEFSRLSPVPRVAFAGDYLLNSTVGQAHYTGLQAAEQVLRSLDTPILMVSA